MDKTYVAVAITGFVLLGLGALSTVEPDKIDVYTVDYVQNNSGALDNQTVKIRGQIVQGPSMCTEMACIGNNTCCNSCSSSVYLGESQEILLKGEDIGCSGTNCEMNCTPETNQEYVVKGTLTESRQGLSLEVENYIGVES